MTLRTIESEFAEQLKSELGDVYPLDLTIDGPIMVQQHPRLIWTKLQLDRNPELEPQEIDLSGWNYQCFPNMSEAQMAFPAIKLKFVGKPWSFHMFLVEAPSAAIIDFPPLGTIVLTKENIPQNRGPELHHHLLPIWTSYALSPELWDAQGKWPAFHARLQKLFHDANLLKGTDSMGYYVLGQNAQKLELNGFVGTNLEKNYVLVMPWTFSLAALNKLEETVRREF